MLATPPGPKPGWGWSLAEASCASNRHINISEKFRPGKWQWPGLKKVVQNWDKVHVLDRPLARLSYLQLVA
jgi:hypothetical protein